MRVAAKTDWAIVASALLIVGLFTAGVVVGATSAAEGPATPEGASRLVSVQQLPDSMNDVCTWDQTAGADPTANVDSSEEQTLFAALQQDPSSVLMAAAQQRESSFPHAEQEEKEAAEARARGARTPVRTIRDTAPTYSAVAVDVNSNEVILQDNNLWEYQVFDRLSPTPAGPADITPPKRTVRGDKTLIQFNNGLYVDPQR